MMALVLADPNAELPMLRRAIPNAESLIVRLHASREVREQRLSRREIGSGLEENIVAAERAAERIAQLNDGFPRIETDGRTVTQVADDVLTLAGWW
jgi:hypothetical protein